jgi:hypothetical protein
MAPTPPPPNTQVVHEHTYIILHATHLAGLSLLIALLCMPVVIVAT